MADNHNVNNAALKLLERQLPALEYEKRRLRCTNHICNLGASAAIYGVNKDSMQDVLDATESQRVPARRRRATTSHEYRNISSAADARIESLQQATHSKVLTELEKLAA